jgi:dolichol kinase
VNYDLKSELRRKSLHLAMIVVPMGLVIAPRFWNVVLFCGTGLALILDLVRLGWARFGRWFQQHFGRFARGRERHSLLGLTYFLVASTSVVLLFPMQVAIASLLFVVLGDAAAALIGRRWGHTRRWGKSIEGALGCLVVCFLAGFWVLADWRISLVGAAVAALVEFLPIPVDDNLRIPLASALAMHWMLTG